MHLLPIIATLRRHRTAATLIVLEIALTCAIVCNAVFIIGDRLARMERPSGIVEDELLRVEITGIGTDRTDAAAVTAQDLNALRTIPGVKSTAVANMVPFGDSSWNEFISTVPDDPSPAFTTGVYTGSQDLLETLGVQLVAGRGFTPDEYVDFAAARSRKARVASVIVTRGVAERLFPGKNPLGQTVYLTGHDPTTIVGVIERLARQYQANDPKVAAYAMVLPVTVPYTIAHNYLLRVNPTRRAEVLAAVDATLTRVDPSRIILERQTFGDIRAKFFRQDRAMAWLLVGVSLALLIITALGVIGLASFWVQQRTRQIGIRRALGATRGDILRYFQTENFLLASAGILLGMALAYAINLWLMHAYQVDRLPGTYLPAGAVLLWLLGQVAVLGPALRASLIPPAVATRTV